MGYKPKIQKNNYEVVYKTAAETGRLNTQNTISYHWIITSAGSLGTQWKLTNPNILGQIKVS